MAGYPDAGQGEHGGPEIYRAYQLIPYLARCQTRSPNDQRHVDSGVAGPALSPGKGAVVAPVEYPGVIREPVFFQLSLWAMCVTSVHSAGQSLRGLPRTLHSFALCTNIPRCHQFAKHIREGQTVKCVPGIRTTMR